MSHSLSHHTLFYCHHPDSAMCIVYVCVCAYRNDVYAVIGISLAIGFYVLVSNTQQESGKHEGTQQVVFIVHEFDKIS